MRGLQSAQKIGRCNKVKLEQVDGMLRLQGNFPFYNQHFKLNQRTSEPAQTGSASTCYIVAFSKIFTRQGIYKIIFLSKKLHTSCEPSGVRNHLFLNWGGGGEGGSENKMQLCV